MNVLRRLFYTLSPKMRFHVRRLYYFPVDMFYFREKNKMIPPKGMIFIGSGDFEKQGLRLMDLVIKYANLQPSHKILDVGCGIGRLAIPLTNYLDNSGEYCGFDIVKKGIDWCNRKIAKRFPNFVFLHIDLQNDLYNLDTDKQASELKFPYVSNYFDCVVLTSVFTHMMPNDVNNYLNQISLVMKKDATCVATFFIYNKKIVEQMEQGLFKFKFPVSFDGYRLMTTNVKEANIAYDESFLLSMIDNAGLKAEHIYQGSWSNGVSSLDFQDVVIIRKK